MKKLYCPRCKRLVTKYSEKTTLMIDVACKKCNKLIVLDPVTDIIVVDKIPERSTLSGMRFY